MFNSRTVCVAKTLMIIAIAVLWSSATMAQPDFDPKISKLVYSPNPRIDRTSSHKKGIEDAIEAGNKARDNGEFETALNSYRKVAEELAPKDARAFFGLGNIYSDLACSDNAIRAYSDALKLNKKFRDAIIGLGNEYANKDRLDEAEAQFRSLLELNPKDTAGSIGLAFVLGKRKQYQEAITKLNLITANRSIDDNARANAHLVLGNIYMDQKRYPDAVSEFKEVIKLKQFLALAYVKLGQATLFPEMSRFGNLVQQEVRIEDREKLISAAKYATENIRKAIYEQNYKHPYGYLLLSYALLYQFNYQDAESNVKTYLKKVEELQQHLPVLKTNCDYGFNQLYALGYLALAQTYLRQGNLETDPQKKKQADDKVIENARKLIQLKETDATAYGMIGIVYVERKQFQEAIEELEKSVTYETNKENKAGTYELIALCYSNIERDKDAIVSFAKARELRPNTTASIWGLARIYERQGNFDEAIRLKKEAIARDPNASSYWMLASTYFARALQKNIDSDFEEAIRSLDKAIETNQTFAPAYFLLGQVYKFYKHGVYADKAIENYEMAARYNPKDASTYFHLGDLYYAVKKNYDVAIKYLGDAIKLDPNLAGAYWELGTIFREKGDDEQARKYFLEAVRADSSHQDAYFGLISIYKSQRNYAEAINLLHKVVEIAPKEAWPHKEMAKVYEAQRKNEDAIKYYQQAIGLLKAEDTFGKELYTCRIERLKRNYAEAIRCFQKLKPLSTEDPGQQAYDIGLTYVASGDKKAAMEQYEQLKKVGSALAAELISQINDMK